MDKPKRIKPNNYRRMLDNPAFTVFNTIIFDRKTRKGLTYVTFVSDNNGDYRTIKNIVEYSNEYTATGLSSAGMNAWMEKISMFSSRHPFGSTMNQQLGKQVLTVTEVIKYLRDEGIVTDHAIQKNITGDTNFTSIMEVLNGEVKAPEVVPDTRLGGKVVSYQGSRTQKAHNTTEVKLIIYRPFYRLKLLINLN